MDLGKYQKFALALMLEVGEMASVKNLIPKFVPCTIEGDKFKGLNAIGIQGGGK